MVSACLITALALPSASPSPSNLVANPGFEEIEAGRPRGWHTENWKLGTEFAVDGTVAHSGTHSVRVGCGTAAMKGVWRQIVPVAGPRHLRFTAWYRTETATAARMRGAVVRLILFRDADTWQELSLPMAWGPPREDWAELATTVYLPAEGTAVGIELFNLEAPGIVWWDDVVLRDATEAEVRQAEAQRLEAPPSPYTVRYAPADGSVSQLDPPAFVWLPVEGATTYRLQYSRDPEFAAGQTTEVACERTIYVPRAALGAGAWHWRFGIAGEDGRLVFSRPRSFTVSDDAAPVPFPDVRAVVTSLSGVRPRDFVRTEDLQRFRELGQGVLRDYLEALRNDAKQYLGGPLLPEPDFLPKEGQERIVAYTRTFRATRPFNAAMVACATVYLLTGDAVYGQEARRRLMHLMSWDPNGSTSLGHNDEPGTEFVRVTPRVYDWIYPLLTADDRAKCREVLAVRIPQVYEVLRQKPFEIHPYESHAMDYYIGDLLEACICMAGELPVEEMLEYVLLQLWSPFFPPYGGDAGGWCEGPSYWQWSTATFLRDFLLVKQNCGVDLTAKPWLRNTPFFKLYCNPPYSLMSPFGDGQSSRAGGGDTMYKLGVVLDNPYALWFANQQNAKPHGLERFLYYLAGDAGAPPSDLPQARVFDDVGLACMHSDLANGPGNVQFMMRSSPFGAISHAYADQNAFILHAYGEPLAIASGYYPYYASTHHSQWTWETKASNSILVDGQGQQTRDWDSTGRIARFETNDYAHYALGDATVAYGGRLKRFLRHALFIRPATAAEEPIVVLYDDLSAARAATYDWLLHALEPMEIDPASQTVTIHRNAARLRVQFLAPHGLALSQTDQFTAPPEADGMPNQWHLTARAPGPQEQCQFVTVLMPYREGDEGRIAQAQLLDIPGWVAIELAAGDARHVVAFRAGAASESTIEISGVRLTGDVLATRLDGSGAIVGQLAVTEGTPR
ncbi:MAG TPA: DUF4962 domain-containing protein [Armatimonadota bacterium]|nr:DUF4962 domain-containing protein [Armatimonadota bacterium]